MAARDRSASGREAARCGARPARVSSAATQRMFSSGTPYRRKYARRYESWKSNPSPGVPGP
ncbi:MAG: hypothetical protein J2P25_00875 [Nocardiopsaceae bacterium]|nr:hypothetical protein [Nocardiopsaceae bacterium]